MAVTGGECCYNIYFFYSTVWIDGWFGLHVKPTICFKLVRYLCVVVASISFFVWNDQRLRSDLSVWEKYPTVPWSLHHLSLFNVFAPVLLIDFLYGCTLYMALRLLESLLPRLWPVFTFSEASDVNKKYTVVWSVGSEDEETFHYCWYRVVTDFAIGHGCGEVIWDDISKPSR